MKRRHKKNNDFIKPRKKLGKKLKPLNETILNFSSKSIKTSSLNKNDDKTAEKSKINQKSPQFRKTILSYLKSTSNLSKRTALLSLQPDRFKRSDFNFQNEKFPIELLTALSNIITNKSSENRNLCLKPIQTTLEKVLENIEINRNAIRIFLCHLKAAISSLTKTIRMDAIKFALVLYKSTETIKSPTYFDQLGIAEFFPFLLILFKDCVAELINFNDRNPSSNPLKQSKKHRHVIKVMDAIELYALNLKILPEKNKSSLNTEKIKTIRPNLPETLTKLSEPLSLLWSYEITIIKRHNYLTKTYTQNNVTNRSNDIINKSLRSLTTMARMFTMIFRTISKLKLFKKESVDKIFTTFHSTLLSQFPLKEKGITQITLINMEICRSLTICFEFLVNLTNDGIEEAIIPEFGGVILPLKCYLGENYPRDLSFAKENISSLFIKKRMGRNFVLTAVRILDFIQCLPLYFNTICNLPLGENNLPSLTTFKQYLSGVKNYLSLPMAEIQLSVIKNLTEVMVKISEIQIKSDQISSISNALFSEASKLIDNKTLSIVLIKNFKYSFGIWSKIAFDYIQRRIKSSANFNPKRIYLDQNVNSFDIALLNTFLHLLSSISECIITKSPSFENEKSCEDIKLFRRRYNDMAIDLLDLKSTELKNIKYLKIFEKIGEINHDFNNKVLAILSGKNDHNGENIDERILIKSIAMNLKLCDYLSDNGESVIRFIFVNVFGEIYNDFTEIKIKMEAKKTFEFKEVIDHRILREIFTLINIPSISRSIPLIFLKFIKHNLFLIKYRLAETLTKFSSLLRFSYKTFEIILDCFKTISFDMKMCFPVSGEVGLFFSLCNEIMWEIYGSKGLKDSDLMILNEVKQVCADVWTELPWILTLLLSKLVEFLAEDSKITIDYNVLREFLQEEKIRGLLGENRFYLEEIKFRIKNMKIGSQTDMKSIGRIVNRLNDDIFY